MEKRNLDKPHAAIPLPERFDRPEDRTGKKPGGTGDVETARMPKDQMKRSEAAER